MTKLQDIIVKEMKVKKRLMKQKKLKVLSHLLKLCTITFIHQKFSSWHIWWTGFNVNW